MTKMQNIAKITLITLALFIFFSLTKSILSSLNLIGHIGGLPLVFLLMTCLGTLCMIIFAVLLVQQLIIRSNYWACRIIPQDRESESTNLRFSPESVYRLISVVLGLLFLYWTLPSFFSFITSLFTRFSSEHASFLARTTTEWLWPRFISFAIRLSITIYLLCGAPHFVRWQVKKTLELAGQIKENTANTVNNPPPKG